MQYTLCKRQFGWFIEWDRGLWDCQVTSKLPVRRADCLWNELMCEIRGDGFPGYIQGGGGLPLEEGTSCAEHVPRGTTYRCVSQGVC